MKHVNNGKCPKCEFVFDRYPGFYGKLRVWFFCLQRAFPEAHVSCAGRGKAEQEAAKARGASRAGYGSSAHNYNAAIDIFEQSGDGKDIYEKEWFDRVVAPWVRKAEWLKWYGEKGSPFFELPHIEVRDWRTLANAKLIKLVEDVT